MNTDHPAPFGTLPPKECLTLQRSLHVQRAVMSADRQVTSLSGSQDEVPNTFPPAGSLPSSYANNKYVPSGDRSSEVAMLQECCNKNSCSHHPQMYAQGMFQ